jgi:uncharacterized protein (DUF2164 family)
VTTLHLDETRRERLIASLQGFHMERFDEDISAFRAEQIVDFMLGSLGAQVYNQAVQDARAYMQLKLDDLDGEVHVVPEG